MLIRRKYSTLILIGIFIFFFGKLLMNRTHIFYLNFRNYLLDKPFSGCVLRKFPLLEIQGEAIYDLSWESSCNWDTAKLSYGIGKMRWIEPFEIDSRHFVYRVTLTDLVEESNVNFVLIFEKPNKVYSFSVKLPPKKGKARLAIISDNQLGMPIFSELLKLVKGSNPDLVIHGGDLVQIGRRLREWQLFFWDLIYYRNLLNVPFLIARGNHDYYWGHFFRYLGTQDYFSFSMFHTQFWLLDSNSISSHQVAWFQSELAKPKTTRFRVAIIHISPFIEYWEKSAWEGKNEKVWPSNVRNNFVEIFEGGKVDLVISGHQHNYQRGTKNGVIYGIFGGGGGDLDTERVADWGLENRVVSFDNHFATLDLSESELNLNVYNMKNQLIDKVTIGGSGQE